MLRRAFKRAAERVLIRSGVVDIARRRVRERALVLAYHNIRPTGESISGDASLHLGQREFARQLDVLKENHEVVSLEQLFDPHVSSDRPRVAITFDDAYSGALSVGLDELVKRGMPATVFVAPGLLGSVAWWDQLAEPDEGCVREAVRLRALGSLGGRTDRILLEHGSRASRAGHLPELPRIATESQLADAGQRPGITFGSHTWSHLNLCSADKSEMRAELNQPLQWLRSRSMSVVPWLSYPYGLHDERVQRAAENAGYAGALRIDGGWISLKSSHALYSLPRLNIPSGLSLDGFRLRIAGL